MAKRLKKKIIKMDRNTELTLNQLCEIWKISEGELLNVMFSNMITLALLNNNGLKLGAISDDGKTVIASINYTEQGGISVIPK